MDRQITTDKDWNWQQDGHSDIPIDRQLTQTDTDRETPRQRHRHTDITSETYWHKETQTGRETDRKTQQLRDIKVMKRLTKTDTDRERPTDRDYSLTRLKSHWQRAYDWRKRTMARLQDPDFWVVINDHCSVDTRSITEWHGLQKLNLRTDDMRQCEFWHDLFGCYFNKCHRRWMDKRQLPKIMLSTPFDWLFRPRTGLTDLTDTSYKLTFGPWL